MSWPASEASPADGLARLARDVRHGLTARPRWLPPKYFYDAAGAALFDRITALPEYYLTRAEDAILADSASAVVSRVEPDEIVELGPGSCHKLRRLLDVGDDTQREAGARVLSPRGTARRSSVSNSAWTARAISAAGTAPARIVVASLSARPVTISVP